jgi:hypothetical protein
MSRRLHEQDARQVREVRDDLMKMLAKPGSVSP